MMETVEAIEVLWLLCCGSAVWQHWRLWRPVHRLQADIDGNRVTASAAAESLIVNDAESELTFMGLFTMLAAAAVPGLFVNNHADRPLSGWVTVVMVFAAVLWTRWRSTVRARRRARVIDRNGWWP